MPSTQSNLKIIVNDELGRMCKVQDVRDARTVRRDMSILHGAESEG